jgi:uncharacterized membrane protein
MTNPFVLIGIFVIVVGVGCVAMGLGALGYDDATAMAFCFCIGLVAIVMGVAIIQLMKGDSLYEKSPQIKERGSKG